MAPSCIVFAAFFGVCICSNQILTTKPIIGILTYPIDSPASREYPDLAHSPTGNATGLVSQLYVDWLYSGGARVVPVPFDATEAELDVLLGKINGVLFTGGGLTFSWDLPYVKTANYIFNKAIQYNDKGDYFPVWGTCMGMQLLSCLAARNISVLCSYCYDSENINLPLNFTPAVFSSRLFSLADQRVMQLLATDWITTNLHHDGIPPEYYTTNSNLSSFFKLISTNNDRKGKPFGSTIEAYNYPIYATQWHPERPPYDFTAGENITHSFQASLVSSYPALWFVNEARKNGHHFTSKSEEEEYLMYRYTPVYKGGSTVIYYV